MNTLDNQLIAVFMGGNCQIIPEEGLFGYEGGTELWFSVFSDHPDPIQNLNFDTDWESIIPVCVKCKEIHNENERMVNAHNDVCHQLLTLNITNVYNSIINFIKEYLNLS